MSLSATPFGSVTETLHGVKVHDPYRWLEDRSLPETSKWIEEQQVRCNSYFESSDILNALGSRVAGLLSVEAVDQPVEVEGHYFYRRRNRNQEQACICMRNKVAGRERLLVDPSCEGVFASVGIHRISDDGSLLAYDIRKGGEDKKEIRILDVHHGQTLPHCIESGFARGFIFAPANEGFYYCQDYSSGSRDHLIQFHPFHGSSRYRTIFSRPRSNVSRLILIGDAFHLGAIWIHEFEMRSVCDLFIAPYERVDDWRPVFVNRMMPCGPMIYGGRIFVLSHEGVSNANIVEMTLEGQETQTAVPDDVGLPRQIVIVGGRFFVNCLRNGKHYIHTWTLDGSEAGRIDVSAEGTVHLLPQLCSSARSLFYAYESFTQPPLIYEYSTDIEESSVFIAPAPPLKTKCYEIREFSFKGLDGTEIPITLVAPKETPQFHPPPVIMTSYGGFGVPTTPQYSVLVAIMLELGAVLALPHIRGGGELGKIWHDAGRGRNRQTAIDDFIASAMWLCSEGITIPAKLAIFGGSNSGLLVGAAMTQRPDLFRAVVCIAPLLDMVRYDRFDQAIRWQTEYGSPKQADDFHALLAYSPYHQVRREVNYPATLFVAGDRDDRCNPAHVRKMAARLQGRAAQRNPILVDYNEQRGHSPVLPLSVRILALTRRVTFLCHQLGVAVPAEVLDESCNL